MSDAQVHINKKRHVSDVLQQVAQFPRKIVFEGPGNIRPDSRYAISEIGADYVVFTLMGDDQMIIPFNAIRSLRIQPSQLIVTF